LFQAEDGIRDDLVTGVQTCALPICQTVRFLLDTGATDISVPGALANRLRLTPGKTSYASTANGTIKVYGTRLDSVALGGLSLANVSAHINPHMQGDTVLLGMSFLQHI